ncbi:MAG: 50S ribosomal protein L22 [Candidatus Methylomirabilota bacterium]|nr:MAG: 50S ribosomal protein L22 [candidate division NC10 bacterium]
MECRAVGRYIGIPPRKARLVVDLIRGRGISQALDTMKYTRKYAARVIEKILKSAIANAQHNHGAKNIDRLFVKEAFVDQGPTIKRFRPRAMGRANPIKKRSSHITIVLTEKEAAL